MDAYKYVDATIKAAKEHIAMGDYSKVDLINVKSNLHEMVNNYSYIIDDADCERYHRIINRLRLNNRK